jgi:hypothetical protein
LKLLLLLLHARGDGGEDCHRRGWDGGTGTAKIEGKRMGIGSGWVGGIGERDSREWWLQEGRRA